MYMCIYIYMIAKFQIEHWDQKSNVKLYRLQDHISRHAQTFPPGYRNLQDLSHRLRGCAELKNSNLNNKTCLATKTMNDIFEMFDFRTNNFRTPGVKRKGLSNAQFRIDILSELCIR